MSDIEFNYIAYDNIRAKNTRRFIRKLKVFDLIDNVELIYNKNNESKIKTMNKIIILTDPKHKFSKGYFYNDIFGLDIIKVIINNDKELLKQVLEVLFSTSEDYIDELLFTNAISNKDFIIRKRLLRAIIPVFHLHNCNIVVSFKDRNKRFIGSNELNSVRRGLFNENDLVLPSSCIRKN